MKFYKKSKKAQATVELALIIGLFLMLMLGFIELARYLHTKYILTNAAREGARVVAKVDKTSSDEEKNQILHNKILSYSSGLKESQFKTISFKEVEKDSKTFVEVDLVYNENTITPMGSLWGLVGLPMDSSASGSVFVISSSVQEKKETSKNQVCPNCGISTVAEAKYCPNCGQKL